MSIHSLKTVQIVPASMQEVWDFISSPKNLKQITPAYMGFDITTADLADKMYAGQIIQYNVKPIFNIPLSWCTEITHVKENDYFVDEQRQGPYAMWHHQHHVKEVANGIEMTDIVHYKAPFGFLGELFTPFLITPKLNEIFQFRFQRIEEIFGKVA